MPSVAKERLDLVLVARGIADTRSRARALILAGDVLVDGKPCDHAGQMIAPTSSIDLKAKPRFVSRGGEKIAHALAVFAVDPEGRQCADVGASTGGFTDCLLQGGAAHVYAIDVGYGQLDQRIREDARVTVLDRTNVRHLAALPTTVSLVTVDVSFISLDLVLPVIAGWLPPGGECLPLIKPQFEAGRKDVGKGGVVRDPAIHRRILEHACESAASAGFEVRGLTRSPLKGPAGNIEYLAHLVRVETPEPDPQRIATSITEVMTP